MRSGALPFVEYDRGADVSDCGTYRYRLWRSWGVGPRAVWCMLNPSTADALDDDPTIRRCVDFAKVWGFYGIEVVNLFAYRATDPRELARVSNPIGPRNFDALDLITRARSVVCAWGDGVLRLPRERYAAQIETLREEAAELVCLGTTSRGQPRHPLYLGRLTERRSFAEKGHAP